MLPSVHNKHLAANFVGLRPKLDAMSEMRDADNDRQQYYCNYLIVFFQYFTRLDNASQLCQAVVVEISLLANHAVLHHQ